MVPGAAGAAHHLHGCAAHGAGQRAAGAAARPALPGGAAVEGRHAAVSYTHLRAHETVLDLVCRLLLEKKKNSKLSQQ